MSIRCHATSLSRGALVVAGALLAATAAEARQAGFAGGTGGGPYNAPCPAFTALTGLSIRAGKAMDHVTPMCSDIRPNKEVGVPASSGAGAGGGGGVVRNGVVCRTHFIVTGMTVFVDKFNIVNHVSLKCTEIGDGRVEMKSWSYEGEVARSQDIACAPGEYANGIYGRYGALVDSVGLLCERAEVIQPALAVKPTPPVTPATVDNSAVCSPYADRMVKRANDLIANKCNTSGLSAGLKTTDRQAYFKSCTGYGKSAASTIEFNERPVADLLKKCLAEGPGTTQKTTTVTADVDLYPAPPPLNQDQKNKALPNGLKKGQKVGFVSCRSDNWCQVTGGWVYGDFITK